ncbi:MAG: uroporphyrinogen III synthase HEM4 [Thermoproteus sp. JCHS_4]|jgi:Uroporphyrinogen-III synthase|nr:MAG: uroporphyrinogen III synthase HEM4 [Thermoproteus sp. JCHS_4]
MSIAIIRIKEGPCPEGAQCISVGSISPRANISIPEGDYLVVMSPAVARAVDLEAVRGSFRCVICVGPATASAVGGCVVPREYSSYGVARLIGELAPGRVVVLRSSAGNDVLRRLLPDVVEVSVYDIYIDGEKLRQAAEAVARSSVVVLTSATVAESIARFVDLSGKKVVAIGPVTSARLKSLGVPHVVAAESTIESAFKTAMELLG